MKRPLLPVALLYAGGVLASELVSLPLFLLLTLSFGLLAVALAWDARRALLLQPLIFLVGWTNATLHIVPLSPFDLRRCLTPDPALVTVRGRLEVTPTLRVYEQDSNPSWRTIGRVRVDALSVRPGVWQQAEGQIAVSTPGMLTNLYGGQTVEVYGVVSAPKAAVAEGTFDYRNYLRQQGVYFQLQALSLDDWRVLSSPAKPPMVDRFSTWARKTLAQGLPVEDESLRLEWALTLGWKTAMTQETAEPFVQAATYHIFAVDGLRMAIIFGIFFGLFRAIGLPRPVCGVILLPLIWFYVALTGWPASAIRATVMLSVVIAGWALKRPSDLVNSLLAAAVIILLWQPHQLFQAGFQLSFLVVLCLILSLPPLWKFVDLLCRPDPWLPSRLHRRWPAFLAVPGRYIADLTVTSFAAWIGSIPLVAYYFNIVTPVSTPANVLAVPLCGLVLVSNLASLLLAGWWPWATVLFNHAGWFLMECIRVSSEWFARWPLAFWHVSAPSLFASALYYALLLGLLTGWLLKPAWRRAKLGVCGLAILVWCAMACREHATSRLSVLPLQGGMAVFWEPAGKGRLLIDSGSTNSARLVLEPFLRARGVTRLPSLMLTHGDSRHVGGATVLASEFSVQELLISPIRFRSPVYRRVLAGLTNQNLQVRAVAQGDRVGAWTVLQPQARDKFPKADDNTLVLRADAAGTRILLLSDLGMPGQEALLSRTPDLRAEIVVSGLPTTGEPLCDQLLAAIQPRLIIVCDSEFPAAEKATPGLSHRLEHHGIPVLYTRLEGAVTLVLRGREWEVRSMNGFRGTSRSLGTAGTAPRKNLLAKQRAHDSL